MESCPNFASISALYAEAELGDIDAMHLIAAMYANGDGVPRDFVEAIKWWENAAAQEDADAQYILGSLYHDGEDVPQDYAKAVSWYLKAANQGHAGAVHHLNEIRKK